MSGRVCKNKSEKQAFEYIYKCMHIQRLRENVWKLSIYLYIWQRTCSQSIWRILTDSKTTNNLIKIEQRIEQIKSHQEDIYKETQTDWETQRHKQTENEGM